MQEKRWAALKHIILNSDELNLARPETAPKIPSLVTRSAQYEGSLEVRVANYERHFNMKPRWIRIQGILPPRPAAHPSRTTPQHKSTKYAIRFGAARITRPAGYRAAGKAISLRYAFPVFHFRSGTAPFWRRHYVMNP